MLVYLALDDLESCTNRKFTKAQYISLFHLPAAPNTDSASPKSKSYSTNTIYKVNFI